MMRTFTIMALGYDEQKWVRPAQMPPFSVLQTIPHTLADELGITGAIGETVEIDVSQFSEALGRHVSKGTLYTAPLSGGEGA